MTVRELAQQLAEVPNQEADIIVSNGVAYFSIDDLELYSEIAFNPPTYVLTVS